MQKASITNNRKADDDCRRFGGEYRTEDEGGSAVELSFMLALIKTFSSGKFKRLSDSGAVYTDPRPCMSFEEVKKDFLACKALMVSYREVTIGKYRADFVFGVQVPVNKRGATSPQFVVIELDGHNFHEKTKYQAQRDKKRDRYLQCKGFIVLRYTGSEVWRSPMGCVYEAILDIAASTTTKRETANSWVS